MLELECVRAYHTKHSLQTIGGDPLSIVEQLYELLGDCVNIPLADLFAEYHVAMMNDTPHDKIQDAFARIMAQPQRHHPTVLRALEHRYQERYRVKEIDDLRTDEREVILKLAQQLRERPELLTPLKEMAEHGEVS